MPQRRAIALPRRPRVVAVAIALLVGLAPLGAGAANGPPAGSPREAVWEFLGLVHQGDLDAATTYLALPSGLRDRGPELAQRLAAVLDHAPGLDVDGLSTAVEGDRDDELGDKLEEIALLADKRGRARPVRLERHDVDDEARWRFTSGTVAAIDGWYENLEVGVLTSWIPPVLRAAGPYGVAWWQWIGLVVIIVLGLALGRLVGYLTTALLCRVARRTSSHFDDKIIHVLAGPITALWSLAAMRLAVPLLELHAIAAVVAVEAISVGIFAAVFWAAMRAMDLASTVVARTAWARRAPSSRALIPLARRALKVAIFVIGAVSLLSALGYPVASLIAGLGIGGIAIALAAQKTVENLFGAFSLGVDQPIREGDLVKVDDVLGTVEEIGLRSTRLRTYDRTVVAIPNARLAEMRLETYAARDRIRLACTLGLVYATTPAQVRAIVDELRATLRDHPQIWPDSIQVHLAGLGESSLDVEIMCWFQTTDWDEFQVIRHDLLLRFLEIVRGAGSDFAFPTRSVELAPAVTAALIGRGRGRDDGDRDPDGDGDGRRPTVPPS